MTQQASIQPEIIRIFSSFHDLPSNVDDLLGLDYLHSGILDSLDVVELITRIEEKFGIQLTHEELTSDEFKSIGGVINIVSLKLSTP